MTHIVTFNMNGLRSSVQKGFLDWMRDLQPDIVLLQEIRAFPSEGVFEDLGYHSVFFPAEKPGYSGVGILSRQKPLEIGKGLGLPLFDVEGRILRVKFEKFSVVSVYAPSATRSSLRQEFKYAFLDALFEYTARLLQEGGVILGGDYNIAHTQADLKNWKSNQKKPGFLPLERSWLDRYLSLGLVDTHRRLLGKDIEYTWWSQRSRAYENDVGWRIDYQFCSRHFSPLSHQVWRSAKMSDHAPLGVVYRLSEV